jgi:hypothetical protein
MKEYKNIPPEIVLVSDLESKIRPVPEIKLTFTSNGIEFGKIKTSVDVYEFIKKIYPEDTIELQEQFYVLYLNYHNKIMGYYRHSVGSTHGTVVDTKHILGTALKSLCTKIILAHNHPSGNTQPSEGDLSITRKLKEGAKLMDLQVIDHLIITADKYYSFADEGLLGNKINHILKNKNTMTKLKSLGKIVDTGNVPKISNADEFWHDHKHPQIIFDPADLHFRKGASLPRTLLTLLKSPEKLPAHLMSEYAIKGFEFGNWTSQEDRQNYMIGLAVSLFDLEKILGFEPKDIGLRGELSIAFGSRGTPNTHGVFETDTFVINLNRHHAEAFKYMEYNRGREAEYRKALLSGGLQSLVHEYGHALDFFCGTFIEKNPKRSLSGGDLNWKVNIRTDEHLSRIMQVIMNKICYNENGKASAYIKRVSKNKHKRKYLLEKAEIFARAFEKYVIFKMKRHGWFNVYFTKFKYEEGKDKTALYNWYLTDYEFQEVEQEFDMLIKHIGMAIHKFKKKVPIKSKGLGALIETPDHATEGMSVADARNARFDLIGLTGEWKNVIGEACKPTDIFVYGEGGSGKTTFVLLFTQYLAVKLNQKILYVAGEQYNTPTFKALLNRLNFSAGANFKIVPGLEGHNLDEYDFIVLDSKDHVGIELPQFIELKKRHPKQSFIILSQSTKAGNYTGTGKWRNVVDVMLLAQHGIIKQTGKNRWGGNGEMKVY